MTAALNLDLVSLAVIDDGTTYEIDEPIHREAFSERVRDYLVDRYGHEADGVTFIVVCAERLKLYRRTRSSCPPWWSYRVLVERGFNGTSWVEEISDGVRSDTRNDQHPVPEVSP